MILLPSVSGPWYCCKIASSATDTRDTEPDRIFQELVQGRGRIYWGKCRVPHFPTDGLSIPVYFRAIPLIHVIPVRRSGEDKWAWELCPGARKGQRQV